MFISDRCRFVAWHFAPSSLLGVGVRGWLEHQRSALYPLTLALSPKGAREQNDTRPHIPHNAGEPRSATSNEAAPSSQRRLQAWNISTPHRLSLQSRRPS